MSQRDACDDVLSTFAQVLASMPFVVGAIQELRSGANRPRESLQTQRVKLQQAIRRPNELL
jgi:hypothetical protein